MKYLIVFLLFASPLLAQDQIIDRYFPRGISDSTVWVFDCNWDNGKIASIVTKGNWWYFPLSNYEHDIRPFRFECSGEYVGYGISEADYHEDVTIAKFDSNPGDQFYSVFAFAPTVLTMEYGHCISTDTTVITKFDTLDNCYLFRVGSGLLNFITSSSSEGNIYYAPVSASPRQILFMQRSAIKNTANCRKA